MITQRRISQIIAVMALVWVGGWFWSAQQAQAEYSFNGAATRLAAAEPTAPLGTSFTYQGQLQQDNAPYTGSCDMEFRLWDAAASGNQIGSTLTQTGLTLSQGQFSRELDFGAAAFDGSARWLEISVRCPAGGGSYTSLGRQKLTAAPYALFASNAAALGGQPASAYQNRVTGSCAVGDAIRQINADGTVVCQPGTAPPQHLTTPIDAKGIVGTYVDVTVGGDGLALISHSDATNEQLKIAHCENTACTSATTSVADNSPKSGRYTSIATGSDGFGLISYIEWNNYNLCRPS